MAQGSASDFFYCFCSYFDVSIKMRWLGVTWSCGIMQVQIGLHVDRLLSLVNVYLNGLVARINLNIGSAKC